MRLTILPKVSSTTLSLPLPLPLRATAARTTTGAANSWVPRSLPCLALSLTLELWDGRGSWSYWASQWIGCLLMLPNYLWAEKTRQDKAWPSRLATAIHGEKSHSRTAASRLITSSAGQVLQTLVCQYIQIKFIFISISAPKRSRGRCPS
jgi:hypothetical protein